MSEIKNSRLGLYGAENWKCYRYGTMRLGFKGLTTALNVCRLVDSLPASHQLLLRYLMVVLRRVGDNSTSNEMTSYNVAACIGQCLLWPCSDVLMSPDSHLAAAKRTNQVVEKMIDAAHEIFGSERLPFLQKSEFSSKASKIFFLTRLIITPHMLVICHIIMLTALASTPVNQLVTLALSLIFLSVGLRQCALGRPSE